MDEADEEFFFLKVKISLHISQLLLNVELTWMDYFVSFTRLREMWDVHLHSYGGFSSIQESELNL